MGRQARCAAALIGMMVLGVAAGTEVLAAKKTSSRDKATDAGRAALAEKYFDQARTLEKQADAAKAAGNAALAEAAAKCAAAKRKTAQGLINDNRTMAEQGVKEYVDAKVAMDAVKPQENPPPAENKTVVTKVKDDAAGKHLRAAVELEQKALEAQQQGLTELAAGYRKCAQARRKVADGYAADNQEMIDRAVAEYKTARTALTQATDLRAARREAAAESKPAASGMRKSPLSVPEYKL